jgi:hypothetical protein
VVPQGAGVEELYEGGNTNRVHRATGIRLAYVRNLLRSYRVATSVHCVQGEAYLDQGNGDSEKSAISTYQ